MDAARPDNEVEKPRRPSSIDLESNSDTSSTHETLDGHRPSRGEIERTISRNSRSASRDGGRTTATNAPEEPPLTRRITRTETVLSRIRSRPVPVFTHALSHVPTTVESLVTFDGKDDPYEAINWPMKKKIWTTMLYGLVTGSASWASSSFAAASGPVAAEFGVSGPVSILGTSMFLAGLAIGPLLWAPLSEVYGRKIAVLPPVFIGMCFSFATGASKDIQSILITRFFGGFFSSAPITNTGGVLGDLYSPAHRGFAIAGYAMAVVIGPALGTFPFTSALE